MTCYTCIDIRDNDKCDSDVVTAEVVMVTDCVVTRDMDGGSV